MKTLKNQAHGFTLIELLVVIAIIGLLSSVVLAAVNDVREKARDSTRIQLVNQLQRALELYYDDNGHYPAIQHLLTDADDTPGCGHNDRWCILESLLEPYLTSELPKDDSLDDTYWYIYNSIAAKGNQWYGLGVFLEDSSHPAALNDGGFFPSTGGSSGVAYEVGNAVGYCMANYSGGDANWFVIPGWSTICRGGN